MINLFSKMSYSGHVINVKQNWKSLQHENILNLLFLLTSFQKKDYHLFNTFSLYVYKLVKT